MSSKFREIKSLIADIEVDVEKFYSKSNKSAGVRTRKALQKVKELAQEVRMDILTKQKR